MASAFIADKEVSTISSRHIKLGVVEQYGSLLAPSRLFLLIIHLAVGGDSHVVHSSIISSRVETSLLSAVATRFYIVFPPLTAFTPPSSSR